LANTLHKIYATASQIFPKSLSEKLSRGSA
jgi:hypothetical protein